MNLGTFCVFHHMEMCLPHLLYINYFEDSLTLDEAREKMGQITGYDFSEGAYFSVGLDYVDCTRLYHLLQLNVDCDEVNEGIKILKRYRPQLLRQIQQGLPGTHFSIHLRDRDAANYDWETRCYEAVQATLAQELEIAKKASEAFRAARRAKRSAEQAVESQLKLHNAKFKD